MAQSRRDLLKKGAAAGAIAWGVPTIVSSPAAQATGVCDGSRPLTSLFYAKFHDDDNTLNECNNSNGGLGNPSLPPGCAPASGWAAGCNQLTQVPTWSDLIGGAANRPRKVTPYFPAGSIPIAIRVRVEDVNGSDDTYQVDMPSSGVTYGRFSGDSRDYIRFVVLYWGY